MAMFLNLRINFLILIAMLITSSSYALEHSWQKKSNVAQYKGADWKNEITRRSGITLEDAKKIADEDDRITYFFYMKSQMYLEGKNGANGWTTKGSFRAKDAVFFSGKPWYGSAPMADAYEKVYIEEVIPEKPPVPEETTTLLEFDQVYFLRGKTKIVEGEEVIEQVATYLKENKGVNLQIVGHTDNVGNHHRNIALSEKRAEKIKSELIKKGIGKSRLKTIGHGANKPIADNNTEEGRAKNRRIEFRTTSKSVKHKTTEEPTPTIEEKYNSLDEPKEME